MSGRNPAAAHDGCVYAEGTVRIYQLDDGMYAVTSNGIPFGNSFASIADALDDVARRATYPIETPSPTRYIPFDHEWSPKTLREKLCTQQRLAPDPVTNAAIGRLIDLLDVHRPLGPDGKHGNRHTPTCGCEDKG